MNYLMNIIVLQARGNLLVVFLGLILMILLLRELFLYQSRAKPFIYYLFLFPGIIAHELAHTIVCLLTFTKINSIKLFSKDGGFVLHQKPKFLPISFLISIAPLASGIAIIYFAAMQNQFFTSSIIDLVSFKSFIILYFLSSILLTMLPSKQDIFNALSAFIAVAVGVVTYYFLSQEKGLLLKINTLLLFCLLLLVALNVIIYIINNIWKSK